MRFSEIPSTARVRVEIAQRRVCKSSLASGKLRIKNGKISKKKKLNRHLTSMWTLIDRNRKEAEFDDTTNTLLRDSLLHEESP